MKKLNKMYEAPKAEMIEMQHASVLMGSITGVGGNDISGGLDDPGIGG